MIPPVEVRQVRPCSKCYHLLYNSRILCRLDKSGYVNVRAYYDRRDPCIDHITLGEMQELITRHNAGELALHDIETRIEDLDGQVENTEISRVLHHALVVELEWVKSLLQQPRQEGQ